MSYALKILIAILVILGANEAAKRLPVAGALIIALPLTSMLAMCFLYYDTHDTTRLAQFARAVPPLIIPSIAFFYAFAFLIEKETGFVMAMLLATFLMLACYGVYLFLTTRNG